LTQFLSLKSNKNSSAKTPAGTSTHEENASTSCGLHASVARHAGFESASFHMPGHKGRVLSSGFARLEQQLTCHDLTELPGLDDLTKPEAAIAQLESRAAALWGADETLVSVGGASAGLVACLIAVAATNQRKKIFVPRNSHRSIVNGLILSGLAPVWYEPVWDSQWSVWGGVSIRTVENLLSSQEAHECAAMVLVSPTYSGALSDVPPIAAACRNAGLTLIVDQAHGAHLLPGCAMPPSAVPHADVTVHSLHKTLSGLTQTGLVHVNAASPLPASAVRAGLGLVHSSSPSYPLMISIEETIALLERPQGKEMVAAINRLQHCLLQAAKSLGSFDIYSTHIGTDPAHVLMRSHTGCTDDLEQFLIDRGIFPEALLGSGLLVLLGVGSQMQDVAALTDALTEFDWQWRGQACLRRDRARPAPFSDAEQVMTPREAFFMPSEVVPIQEAIGRIAQQCVAPCPPGIPLSVPGQRVHQEVMNVESLRSLRVLLES
jgi:arginine/lysine/ornithine decarboxylase